MTTCTCSNTYLHIQGKNLSILKNACRYDLHVLLVEHGKRCARCASGGKPRKEQHGPCPLFSLSAAADEGAALTGEAVAENAEGAVVGMTGFSFVGGVFLL